MTASRPLDRGEFAEIAAAVGRAPSVHNTQPWLLEFADDGVAVLERRDITLAQHDPRGRDRMMSCGAALATAQVAVRRFGRQAGVFRFPAPGRPEVVGMVRWGAPQAATERDLAAYRAIRLRHSHRRRFAERPVAPELVRDLLGTRIADGVQLAAVAGPRAVAALAKVLAVAADAIREDQAYQRELAAWTAVEGHPGTRDGYLPAPAAQRELPWAGLVDRDTELTPEPALADRLAAETQLLITTTDDGRADHLDAGMAVQQLWLALTAHGLVGSVLTQPLHAIDARAGLIEQLELTGFPQALLRIGYPAEVAPSSRRHPPHELVRPPRSVPQDE